MAKIINFPTMPSRVPCSEVLEASRAADLADVLVIGFAKHDELYVASSCGSLGNALLMMERAKALLNKIADDYPDAR